MAKINRKTKFTLSIAIIGIMIFAFLFIPINMFMAAPAVDAPKTPVTSGSETSEDETYTPGINIITFGPLSATIGQTISYTHTVTNTGNVSLSNIVVKDSVTGNTTYQSGDLNNNKLLDITETWIFTNTWVVKALPNPLVNTATVSGNYNSLSFTATDTWTVDVFQLTIVKTTSTSYTRTYGWTIDNSVTPNTLDLLKGDSGTSTYRIAVTKDHGTDTNWLVEGTINIHNPAVTPIVILSMSNVISGVGSTEITNPVEFPYTLEAGKNLVLTYRLELPNADNRTSMITIKIADTDKIFTAIEDLVFGVPTTQVNDSITVTDSYNPAPDPWVFSSSGLVTYDRLFTEANPGSNVNIATIEQTGQTDDATVTVKIFNPSISIVKDGPTFAKAGETAVYTFIVTNVGNVPLSNVTVFDNVTGFATYVLGDSNKNEYLDLDEVWFFIDTSTVDASFIYPTLPSNVTIQVNTERDTFPFTTIISDVPAGFGITNGTFTGYCCEMLATLSGYTPYNATLSSTLELDDSWNKINYMLNHKQGTSRDVQAAIWLLQGYTIEEIEITSGFTPSTFAIAMCNDAELNGAEFIHGPSQILAIKCDLEYDQDQIIEYRLPSLQIVNSATVSALWINRTVISVDIHSLEVLP